MLPFVSDHLHSMFPYPGAAGSHFPPPPPPPGAEHSPSYSLTPTPPHFHSTVCNTSYNYMAFNLTKHEIK